MFHSTVFGERRERKRSPHTASRGKTREQKEGSGLRLSREKIGRHEDSRPFMGPTHFMGLKARGQRGRRGESLSYSHARPQKKKEKSKEFTTRMEGRRRRNQGASFIRESQGKA